YGRLREAWERAIEEVLLANVVQRFRKSIQTQQIKSLAKIEESDCQTIERAMTRSSKFLRGHDSAHAANPHLPDPEELRADIDELRLWIASFNKR
ncbi:MAG: ATP-binding protein, partial [Sphaerobacteraceae bacterium]